ncbi:hypothetical protein chiPu_0031950 [Chiloscyllium punctatum]|uniref:Uncharacterized protein n=1 Tax=Chiloscyllium punctatum TaxID=137246 RepID=A0A401TZ29_CHIPU|nr:hypothetical protein [Chiloscyllium punctatum]
MCIGSSSLCRWPVWAHARGRWLLFLRRGPAAEIRYRGEAGIDTAKSTEMVSRGHQGWLRGLGQGPLYTDGWPAEAGRAGWRRYPTDATVAEGAAGSPAECRRGEGGGVPPSHTLPHTVFPPVTHSPTQCSPQ